MVPLGTGSNTGSPIANIGATGAVDDVRDEANHERVVSVLKGILVTFCGTPARRWLACWCRRS